MTYKAKEASPTFKSIQQLLLVLVVFFFFLDTENTSTNKLCYWRITVQSSIPCSTMQEQGSWQSKKQGIVKLSKMRELISLGAYHPHRHKRRTQRNKSKGETSRRQAGKAGKVNRSPESELALIQLAYIQRPSLQRLRLIDLVIFQFGHFSSAYLKLPCMPMFFYLWSMLGKPVGSVYCEPCFCIAHH